MNANVAGALADISIQCVHMPVYVAVFSHTRSSNMQTFYTTILDGGITTRCLFEELITSIPYVPAAQANQPASDPFLSLPHQFQWNSKLTIDHNGSFHKGFLTRMPNEVFFFEC